MTVEEAPANRALTGVSAPELDWNAVYAEQLPRVYNYFRFRLGRHADVEDLTSRTFEKAWRARNQYRRDIAGFSAWLFGIARNVAADDLRSRRVHLPLEAANDSVAASSPENEASLSSDMTRLARLTARLSERQQEILALKYGAAVTNRVIASITGLTESNVGTILQRMVEKLRSQW